VGVAFEQADHGIRRWPAATLGLLALAALFGSLLTAH
jgi:hypothetical protein